MHLSTESIALGQFISNVLPTQISQIKMSQDLNATRLGISPVHDSPALMTKPVSQIADRKSVPKQRQVLLFCAGFELFSADLFWNKIQSLSRVGTFVEDCTLYHLEILILSCIYFDSHVQF